MISITNAGRGAGKTYQLIQWAKEDPNRRIVGNTNTRNAMAEQGIANQFIFFREAKKELQGRYDITGVAFDDFGHELYQLLYNEYGVYPETETILSMSVEERRLPRPNAIGIRMDTRIIVSNSRSMFNRRHGVVTAISKDGLSIWVRLDQDTYSYMFNPDELVREAPEW